MESAAKARRAAFEKQFAGYLLAVTGAAATATIVFLVQVYLRTPAPIYDLTRLWEFILVAALLILVFWIYACFWTIIPFVAVIKVARRFEVTNISYFLVSGAFTGVLLAPVLTYFRPTWYTDPPEQPPFAEQVADILPLCVPAGIVGALLYWWKVIRTQRLPVR
ncbi:MAG TPA: hypothetical protein VJL90_08865 [Pseudorhodoplanes sp.]|nr:hypothetical protein [Pseudorhodoplanes sp.]